MRTFRRLVLLAVVAGALLVGAAPAADATCTPGRISVKPLVIQFPECHPPGGGPG